MKEKWLGGGVVGERDKRGEGGEREREGKKDGKGDGRRRLRGRESSRRGMERGSMKRRGIWSGIFGIRNAMTRLPNRQRGKPEFSDWNLNATQLGI